MQKKKNYQMIAMISISRKLSSPNMKYILFTYLSYLITEKEHLFSLFLCVIFVINRNSQSNAAKHQTFRN